MTAAERARPATRRAAWPTSSRSIDVVAGVNAIYASDKRRTQETAAPLAKRLNMPVEIADHHDIEGFMDRVLDDHDGDIVLIVSHSDTIAPLIDELHGSKRLPPFGARRVRRGLHRHDSVVRQGQDAAACITASRRGVRAVATTRRQGLQRQQQAASLRGLTVDTDTSSSGFDASHAVSLERRVRAAELHGSAPRSRDTTTRTTCARARRA